VGLLNILLENAAGMSVEEATKEYGHVLAKGEGIEAAH